MTFLRSAFLHLLVLDLRVKLSEPLLILCKEVESALMVLWLTMLGAEDVGAFARNFD